MLSVILKEKLKCERIFDSQTNEFFNIFNMTFTNMVYDMVYVLSNMLWPFLTCYKIPVFSFIRISLEGRKNIK